MTPTDRAALKLAIEMARAEDKGRREQVDHFLASRPWQQVGEFCSGVCQSRRLGLMPWQRPPCDVIDGGDPVALALLKKMQRLGISRWHPDPAAALAEAEAKAAS